MTTTEKAGSSGPMKMSQLARASGLTVSTIKFYISQGLLPRPEKAKPNVAYYDGAFLKRLLIIKKMRAEGLSISSIKSILDRYPFSNVSDWEAFKKKARKKGTGELEEEERLATLSDEERRTEAILDAAFDIFSIKGYHNSTVDDIARQAGVSKGTCYQYFSGKEEMFIATINRTLDRLTSEAEAAAEGGTDALQRLAMKGLNFIPKYHELQFMFIGMFTEIMGGNEKMRRTAISIFDRVAEFLSKDIEEGMEAGIIRPVDSRTVASALVGIAGAAGNLTLIDKEFDVLQFFVNLMDFIQHGLTVNSAGD